MGQREDIMKELQRRKVIAELKRRSEGDNAPELTPEQKAMAQQGEAARAEGGAVVGADAMPASIKAEAETRGAADQILSGVGASGMRTAQGVKQILGGDVAEQDVQNWRGVGDATGLTKTGEIAGDVAQFALPGKAIEAGVKTATKGIPLARSVMARYGTSGAATGAGAGALEPVVGDESRGKNIAQGAATGGVLGGALGAAGGVAKRIAQPFKPSPGAAKLMDKGVQPTLGQGADFSVMGHYPLKTLENTLRLLTGASQKRARQEAAENLLNMANPLDEALDTSNLEKAFIQLEKNFNQAGKTVKSKADMKVWKQKRKIYDIFEAAKNSTKGDITPESLRREIGKVTSGPRFAQGKGIVQKELAELEEVMPELPDGAWGGFALASALFGRHSLPATVLGATRGGSKTAFGRSRMQQGLKKATEAVSSKTRGATSALAGTVAAQSMIHEEP